MLAWRMARQHLVRRLGADDALRVVRELGGLHAQLDASADLTLRVRVVGLAPEAVVRAVRTERTLLRTWTLRGTLHLIPTDELPLWTAAQSRVPPRHHVGSWLRHHGLTRPLADAMLEAIPRALADGPLTRADLARRVATLVGEPEIEERLRGGFGDLLKPAAFRGDLVFAPDAGREARFVRPDLWVDTGPPVDPGDAVREIARRYLAAYGPATREDLARWFGLRSPAEAERWIRASGDGAVQVAVDGRPGWLLAEHVDEALAAEPSGTVRLLPAFDQYVVAAPRGDAAVLDPARQGRVYRPQGWLSPVLVVDGRIAGVWRHERRGGRVAVTIEPFGSLGADVEAAAAAEAAALAEGLGGPVDVTWGAVGR